MSKVTFRCGYVDCRWVVEKIAQRYWDYKGRTNKINVTDALNELFRLGADDAFFDQPKNEKLKDGVLRRQLKDMWASASAILHSAPPNTGPILIPAPIDRDYPKFVDAVEVLEIDWRVIDENGNVIKESSSSDRSEVKDRRKKKNKVLRK